MAEDGEPLRALEAALVRKRRAGEVLLDADAYDRWGAVHDSDEGRAAMAERAQRAEEERRRAVEELETRVRRLRREDSAIVARWVELHDRYLAGVIERGGTPAENTFESTALFVARQEREAWAAVGRGERDFVDENVYYVKLDPAQYEAIFGFPP